MMIERSQSDVERHCRRELKEVTTGEWNNPDILLRLCCYVKGLTEHWLIVKTEGAISAVTTEIAPSVFLELCWCKGEF